MASKNFLLSFFVLGIFVVAKANYIIPKQLTYDHFDVNYILDAFKTKGAELLGNELLVTKIDLVCDKMNYYRDHVLSYIPSQHHKFFMEVCSSYSTINTDSKDAFFSSVQDYGRQAANSMLDFMGDVQQKGQNIATDKYRSYLRKKGSKSSMIQDMASYFLFA